MPLDSQHMDILTAFGKAFLLELEKGEEGKATLFAKAFLACRELKSEKDQFQRPLNDFL
jgi:hypothetical protein